jgi:STE24 endopeptidase
MNEDKSARYHRLSRWLSIASLGWTAAFLVAVLASGLSARLRDLAAAAGGPAPLTVALVMVGLAALHEPIAFLLSWYRGYVVEHRYGLSRQTAAQWLADHLKGALVGGTLALLVGVPLYAAIAAWPEWWWLVAGLGFSLVMVALANLAPVLLLPLFFRFEPLDHPTLGDRLRALADRAGARIVGVYRWELGAKTSKANAALAGIGGTRRILLADTMLAEYSEDEIEVVLAHELGHHVHRDIWSGIALETILTLAGFYLAHVVLGRLGTPFGLAGQADPAGLPLLLLAAGAVSILLLPLALAVSRRHERRADRFALDLTAKPAAFVSAMKRLGVQNLAEERPSALVQWLFYSHPPLEERIAAAHAWTRPAERPGCPSGA